MNKVHAAIIAHLRKSSADIGSDLHKHLETLTDPQVVKLMFSSVRGRGETARGLRLTNSGLQMMMEHFKYFEVKFPEGHKLQANELVYLDRRAHLPYFCSAEKIVLFETELGMKLKLMDGDITRLCEIETL